MTDTPDLLCYAWGESDKPCAAIVQTRDQVRQFVIDHWLGSEDAVGGDGEPSLPSIMTEFDEHEWDDHGGVLSWEFEIGGLEITQVVEVETAPSAAAPDTPPVDWNMRRLVGLWRFGRDVLPIARVPFEGWLFQLDGLIDAKAPTPDGSMSPTQSAFRALDIARDAIQANHTWHQEYDDHDGYPGSEIEEHNRSAASTIDSVLRGNREASLAALEKHE